MPKIIFVDNSAEFLETRSEILSNSGFHVLTASSAEDADLTIASVWVHLMILDVRLSDDDDEKDWAGIQFAQKHKRNPTIFLTNHASSVVTMMRQLIELESQGRTRRIRIVEKSQPTQYLLDTIEAALREDVRINFSLQIADPTQARQIAIDEIHPEAQPELSEEFNDLLGATFFECDQVLIQRVLWQHGGRVALAVSSVTGTDRPAEFVVVCGSAKQAEHEAERVQSLFATHHLGLHFVGQFATLHFGAVVYRLDGTDDLSSLQPMQSFFGTGNADRTLQKALPNLMKMRLDELEPARMQLGSPGLLTDWWTGALNINFESLDADVLHQRWLNAIAHLPAIQATAELDDTQQQATVHVSHGRFLLTDFAHQLPATLQNPKHAQTAWITALSAHFPHGLLCDEDGNVWVTDWAEVDMAPAEWHFTSLEAAIRFDWMWAGKLPDLFAVHKMEEQLSQATTFAIPPDVDTLDAPTRRAISCIKIIRKLAGRKGSIAMPDYQRAMLAHGLTRFLQHEFGSTRDKRSMMRGTHLFVSLCKACEALTDITAVKTQIHAHSNLIVNDTERVATLNGERLSLSQTEMDVLICLNKQRGRAFSRKEIYERVLNVPYDASVQHVNWVNSNIRHLRDKIGEDTIRTEAGVGYSLVPSE